MQVFIKYHSNEGAEASLEEKSAVMKARGEAGESHDALFITIANVSDGAGLARRMNCCANTTCGPTRNTIAICLTGALNAFLRLEHIVPRTRHYAGLPGGRDTVHHHSGTRTDR